VNKIVIVYLILLVAIVVVALYLSGFLGKIIGTSTTTTTMSSTSTLSSTSTSTSSSTTSTIETTTTIIFSSCISKQATSSIPNGNFSTGTYADWNLSGPGFGSVPFNLTFANSNTLYYGSPWSGYNGMFFASTFHGGQELQSGNITSSAFTVSELYLNFKIISPQSDILYVEILQNGTPRIITHYNTFDVPGVADPQSVFMNASIPLGELLCQNISVKVVAGITGNPINKLSYIAVGDFYLSRVPISTPGIVVNQTIN
jgi:hypothetical protein